MFCSSCGTQISDTANFCGSCGSAVKRAAVPSAQPLSAPSISQGDPSLTAGARKEGAVGARREGEVGARMEGAGPRAICPWCGASIEGGQLSCSRCGATVDAPPISTASGWEKLPGRKDMAKLQFGDSFCQIEGKYVPVADVKLAGVDSVYFTHHVLLWKDPQVNITTMSLAGGWKRLLAGMPLIMTQAQGPGHIAFSRDAPGEMIALPIQPGQAVDVREHLFMLATDKVAYEWFSTNIFYTTQSGSDNNERETHYPVGMFMDRFHAPQSPGLLILHASGNVFVRELAANQTILVKPTSLIFKDPAVQMQLHFEQPRTGFSLWGSYWANRYMWLRLWGPGRVAVQSVFDRMEGENGNITNCSSATERRW